MGLTTSFYPFNFFYVIKSSISYQTFPSWWSVLLKFHRNWNVSKKRIRCNIAFKAEPPLHKKNNLSPKVLVRHRFLNYMSNFDEVVHHAPARIVNPILHI